MGRSRRKGELPEMLRPLEGAGMPEGYGDFWYGGDERPIISAFFPSALEEDIENLERGVVNRDRILELLGEMKPTSKESLEDDRLLRAIWEAEGMERVATEGVRSEWLRFLSRRARAHRIDGERRHTLLPLAFLLLPERYPERSEVVDSLLEWSEEDPTAFRQFLDREAIPSLRHFSIPAIATDFVERDKDLWRAILADDPVLLENLDRLREKMETSGIYFNSDGIFYHYSWNALRAKGKGAPSQAAAAEGICGFFRDYMSSAFLDGEAEEVLEAMMTEEQYEEIKDFQIVPVDYLEHSKLRDLFEPSEENRWGDLVRGEDGLDVGKVFFDFLQERM